MTCSNIPAVFTATVNVNSGDGNYTSPTYKPLYTGSYFWIVTYSGDINDLRSSSPCGGMGGTVTVNAAGRH